MDIDEQQNIVEERQYRPRLIRDLDDSEKPREKAMAYGIDALSDVELLAIIFATGIKGKSVIDICKEILATYDNHLSRLARASVQDICRRFKGIGKVKAITLLAALKLGERATEDAESIFAQAPVTSADVAYKQMRGRMQWLQHEEFWVMMLSRAGKAVATYRVSQGGTAATTVDVKVILRYALECSADGMILFHNHPSGTLRPSDEDDKLTKRIAEAAKLLGIRVHDHIIITDTAFYSYNEHNRL